jgi:hypothetical protein
MSQRHLFVPFILRPAGTRHYLSTNLSLDFRRHDGSYVRVGGVVFDTAGGFTTLPAGWARHVGIQFETTTASELPVIGVTGKGVAYLNRATFSFPDIPHTHFTSLCAFSPTAPYPLLALGDVVNNFHVSTSPGSAEHPRGAFLLRLRSDHSGRPRA